MRLLFDQMLDEAVKQAVAKMGHDVIRTSETGLEEADDSEIMNSAILQGRILNNPR